MTHTDKDVERVAKAIRDQNRRHMKLSNPALNFDRDELTADEIQLARAAISALPQREVSVQEAAINQAAEIAIQGYVERQSDRYALGVQAGISRMTAALRALAGDKP